MVSSILLIFPLLIATTLADNDWSKPCLSGVCEYDLLNTNGTASGTLKIWGGDGAISDITTAAGWQIINCSPDALSQDIRLVCTDEASGNCAHLYSNSSTGAVGKIVRLPDNCGKSAFAVVTKVYRPQDQSIPASVSASLSRLTGSNTTVQGLSISTKFGSIATPSTGPVNFAIRAANVPGAGGDLVTPQRRCNSRVFRRGVSDFVSNAVNNISSLNNFDVDKSTTLQPFDVDKTFTLVDQSISCGPIDAQVKVDVETKAHAVASIGVAASGTILPPEVLSFAVITGLDGEIDGSITLTAEASGSLDSGKISLFEVGVPGLDFPGILTVGPSFKIEGQATASLDADVGLTVGLTYTISGAQLVFPPNANQGSKGAFNIGDTPLTISASPTASASGTVEAHLIPSLNLGISALGDTVDATIFLELDASASMTLSAQAAGDASATLDRRGARATSIGMRGQNLPGRYFRRVAALLGAREPQSDDGDDSDAGDDDNDNSAAGADGADSDNRNDDSADSTADSGAAGDANGDDDSTPASTDDADADPADDIVNTADDNSADTADGADPGSDTSNDDTSVDSPDDSNDDGSGDDSDDTVADDGGDTSADDDSAGNGDNTIDDDSTTDSDDDSDTADPTSGDTSDADSSGADAATSDDSTDSSDAASGPPNTNSTTDATPTDSSSTNTDPTASDSSSSAVTTSTSGSFSGCFDIEGALDVNAGATGSFFGLFDKSTKVELFSKKFEIFKKCFGSGADNADNQKRSLLARRPVSMPLHAAGVARKNVWKRASLQCPSADINPSATLESLVDETVSASSIQ